MVIWSGLGFLALIIAAIVFIATQFAIDAAMGAGSYQSVIWAIPLAGIISGALIYFIGNMLNSKPGKILIDPDTNQPVELKRRHTLFWIPMQFWGLIVAIGSIVMAFI